MRLELVKKRSVIRSGTRKRRNNKENREQEMVVNWANYHKDIGPYLFHIPNGGYRDDAEAAVLKRMGVKSGVSDLFLAVPKNGYHGLWIEMKSKDGAKPTDNQQEWLDRMNNIGYLAVCCFGGEIAINVIKRYMNYE